MNSNITVSESDVIVCTPTRDEESSKQRWNFVQHYLSTAFSRLGCSIGKNPLPYFTVPIILTAILSVGFYWINLTKELEYLVSPIHGRFIKERTAIETLFPPANNEGIPLTVTRFREIATVLIEPKDRGSILREDIFEEALRIDKTIHNLKISWNNKVFTFEDLCSKTNSGKCPQNEVLSLRGKIEDIKRKKFLIKYPFEVDEKSKQVSLSGYGLGSVTNDERGNVLDAKAMRLIYMLNYSIPERAKINQKWEESFLEEMSKIKSDHIKISRETNASINNELNKLTEMAMPLLSITIFFIVTFAVLSSMTRNWVTSKPWVAIAGCLSPMLGALSTFGLLLLCGFPYIDINIAILFILTGIGLDDSFILLAAWRRTDPAKKVEERMRQTYSEAAISITITSITNVLSLFVGFGSPYRITRIYCVYATLSMVFAYFTQITFYGGVLALSGIREKKNLHSILFIPVKKETIPDSLLLRLLYLGFSNPKDCHREQYSSSTRTEKFLNIIITPYGRLIVLFCFITYLVSSAYCLKFVQERFNFKEAAPSNSYVVDYLDTHYKHFTEYTHPIHLVINKTLDYSDKNIQKDIEDTIRYFANGPNMAGENVTLSWLKYYLQSIRNDVLSISYRGYNMSDPSEFIAGLRDVFLKFPYSKEFRPHIRFNHDKTEILASRFIIVSKNINTSYLETNLLSTLWNKADACRYPIYVYNFWFPMYSVLLPVGSSCLETLSTAVGIVALVFFIFIPNIFCAISILLTIASILTGVIGYMSLWNVTINPVSIITLMISVGLSVDYAAHISYAYLSCREKCPNKKTITSLRVAGYPIIQGCVSTLLGVAVIAFGPSKIFLVFFKVITLVMLIALLHGLFVIPVAFNTFETLWIKIAYRSKKKFCNGN